MVNDDADVWGSDSDGAPPQRRSSASELDHEWQARQSQFHTLGYRDGVEAGKISSAQEGFNAGYAEATTPGFNWGVTRGLCTAYTALPDSVRESLIGEKEARVRLDGLAFSIHRFSSVDAQRSFYRDLNRNGDQTETHGQAEAASGGELGLVGTWESTSRDELGLVGSRESASRDELGMAGTQESASRDELGLVGAQGSASRDKLGLVGTQESASRDELGLVGTQESARGDELGLVGTQESASGDELGLVGISRFPEPHAVGVWERENPSSRAPSGVSELEELETNVRREFERASIKVSF